MGCGFPRFEDKRIPPGALFNRESGAQANVTFFMRGSNTFLIFGFMVRFSGVSLKNRRNVVFLFNFSHLWQCQIGLIRIMVIGCNRMQQIFDVFPLKSTFRFIGLGVTKFFINFAASDCISKKMHLRLITKHWLAADTNRKPAPYQARVRNAAVLFPGTISTI